MMHVRDRQTSRREPARPVGGPASGSYTSRIIKAGALLADTKTLLAQWDVAASVGDNLTRIRHENLFGKASRSRVEDILGIFRQRYLNEESVVRALSVLVHGRFPAAALDRVLYFHAARADRLLYDVVVEFLRPRHAVGRLDLPVADLTRQLTEWVENGKTAAHWSEPTIRRIAQGLLSTLRDFVVLEGAAHKRIAPVHLPVHAFAYIAFYLKQNQPSGVRLLESNDWKLFFLTADGVERSMFEAHQHGLLEYHVAGSVTRLTFPATTFEEYAHVLAAR